MSARKLARLWLLSVLTVAPTDWATAAGPSGRARSSHRPLIAQSASKARPPARRRAPAPPSETAEARSPAADVSRATDLSAPTPATAVSTPAIVASTPATPVAATTQVGAASTAPFTPLAAPQMTLWRFLGVPQGLSRLGGATLNRRGNFPGLEPKPPLKALADPANLLSDNKMLKKAALIKQQEDLKKQKIKALKYLATIGCGCYNRNPKEPTVQEAFIEGLKDCTEEVRYQAAVQLANAAENKCEYCSKNCCCDAKVMQVLSDIAMGRDENGCFNEPSARVREAACEALMACRRAVPVYPAPVGVAPIVPDTETIPQTPDTGETIPGDVPQPPAPNEARNTVEGDELLGEILNGGQPAGQTPPRRLAREAEASSAQAADASIDARPLASADAESVPASSNGPHAWYAIDTSASPRPAQVASRSAVVPARNNSTGHARLSGSVVGVDMKTMTVGIDFPGNRRPAVGAKLSVLHHYAFQLVHLGELEVVYVSPNGRAIAQPVGKLSVSSVAKGDQVMGRFVPRPDSEIPEVRPATDDRRPAIAAHKPAASDQAKVAEQPVERPSLVNEDAAEHKDRAASTSEPQSPAPTEVIALLDPLPESEVARPVARVSTQPANEAPKPKALRETVGEAAPLAAAKPARQTDTKALQPATSAEGHKPAENHKPATAPKPRSGKSKIAAIRFLSESTSASAIPIATGEATATRGVWAHD